MSTYFRVSNPDPELLKAARTKANLTQQQAAVKAGLDKQQRWAEYERGVRNIDPVRWEYFLLQVGLHPAFELVRR